MEQDERIIYLFIQSKYSDKLIAGCSTSYENGKCFLEHDGKTIEEVLPFLKEKQDAVLPLKWLVPLCVRRPGVIFRVEIIEPEGGQQRLCAVAEPEEPER